MLQHWCMLPETSFPINGLQSAPAYPVLDPSHGAWLVWLGLGGAGGVTATQVCQWQILSCTIAVVVVVVLQQPHTQPQSVPTYCKTPNSSHLVLEQLSSEEKCAAALSTQCCPFLHSAGYVYHHASVEQDGCGVFATFQASRLQHEMAECKMKLLLESVAQLENLHLHRTIPELGAMWSAVCSR